MKYGTGIEKSGWGKPVPLLGMTKQQAEQVVSSIKSRGVTQNTVKNMNAFRNNTVPSTSIPGRFFSSQAAWMAAAEAQNELRQYRLDPTSPAWEFVDQAGSIVGTGLSYINPLLGALAGPAVEGIAQLATQAAKNNVFEGSMGFGSKQDVSDFQQYTQFLKDNPDIVGITLDDWKQYNNKLQEATGGSCQQIQLTEAELAGQSVEDYMKTQGINPSGPEPEKPKSKGSSRQPTQAELDALAGIRWGGG
jgi:hypothetical protein